MSDLAARLDEEEATILLVDDRPQNLLALEALLEPLGHRLITARSGEQALRVLLSEDVAVILLDVQMPDMDGFETARHIKSRQRTEDIPILFITAEAGQVEEALRGFSTGAVDYVSKPVDEWVLRAKVQVFVDLALKTRLLQRQSRVLAHRLDAQVEQEVNHLRKLAQAALVINSSLSLSEMLKVINESAREIIGAHEAETVLQVPGGGHPGQTRAYSGKYRQWAMEGREVDLTPLYSMVWSVNHPVRMTKDEITTSLAARGLVGIMPGHPLLEGWLAVPITGRSGRTLGLIQLADKIEGDFVANDEAVLAQLADLAAVAIENAERYEQEHRIAEILQRSLLPEGLPAVPGVSFAAHYQPGGGGTQVGGDWYDVFRVDARRVAVLVGDVAGHGLRAAGVMGRLRTALRAYAIQGGGPRDWMREVDGFLQAVDEGSIATLAVLVVDATSGDVEVVSAGHLPPLLVTAGGDTRFLDEDADPPLGVMEEPSFRSSRHHLEPGAILLLYSDGLVEDRGESLDAGLKRLAAAVDLALESLDAVCDQLVETVAPAEKEDDITIVAVRRDPAG